VSDDSVPDNENLVAVFLDPEDYGFYKSRAKQWATLCPHMNPTEYRIFTVLLDLCSERNGFRKLTLKEIAAIVPAGRVALGEASKTISVSTVANAINALVAIGQITDEHGKPLRVSNKTKGEIRLAPWRSLRHDCDTSRNVRDALARARGAEGEDGPRWPLGLGSAQDSVPTAEPEENPAQDLVPTPDPAQDSVPAAQDLVPAAQDSVPTAQEAVPAPSQKQGSTSENTDPAETPSSSSSSTSSRTPTHTPRPRTTVEDESDPEPVTGVCVSPEQREKIIETVRVNLIDRAPGSRQKDIAEEPKLNALKGAIIELAVQCVEAGADVKEIDATLSGAINGRTTHPYTHGTTALHALLEGKQRNAKDPLGAPRARSGATNSYVDETGFEWPHHEPYARECQGQSCGDWNGKRYVAMEDQFRADGSPLGLRPVHGLEGKAFSCPVCRAAYKKEAASV